MLEPQPSDQALSLHDSQALLSIARVLVPCRDIDELLRLLATELSRIVIFDDLSLSVYDAGSGTLRLRTSNHSDAPAHATPVEFNADGPAAAAFETLQPVIIRDALNETRFPSAITLMRGAGWRSLCHWPLITPRRRLGTLNLASRKPLNYDPRELELLGEVARMVAVAVDNAIDFETVHSLRSELEGDRDQLKMLLEVTNALVVDARPTGAVQVDRLIAAPGARA